MKYGCIGERLKHSFSKEIHNALSDYEYEILEIEREKLEEFAKSKNFAAINVTIPYKELIMPYMQHIDEHALKIGSVNTVLNKDGVLYGYNTDFYGMEMLIEHAGISVFDKKAVILGTGGTSKTAYAVLSQLGAREIIRVSRSGKEGAITYNELYEKHTDAEIIINTTPVGMYPNIHAAPVDVSRFTSLSGVIDVIYNPLRTRLITDAKKAGIPAKGGLYMLVAQGVRASEIFTGCKYPEGTNDRIFNKTVLEKENIVLIGMPSSGKSTIGKILKERLGKELIDTDALIEKKAKMSISEIFNRFGEDKFRDIESEVIAEAAKMTSLIIATGGGAVLREENREALKMNGRVFFLDRPLELLIPTADRPLADDSAALAKRFSERYDTYLSFADEIIDAKGEAETVANEILKKVMEQDKK